MSVIKGIETVHRNQWHIGQQGGIIPEGFNRQPVEAFAIGPRNGLQTLLEFFIYQSNLAHVRTFQLFERLRRDPGTLQLCDHLAHGGEETGRAHNWMIEGQFLACFELSESQPQDTLARGPGCDGHRLTGAGENLLIEIPEGTDAHSERTARLRDSSPKGRNLRAVRQHRPARPDRLWVSNQQPYEPLCLAAGGGREQDGRVRG